MLQTKWRVNPVWRGSSNEISMHRISRRAPSIRALRILHPSAQTNVPFSLQNCSLFQKKKPHRHILPHPSIHPSLPIPEAVLWDCLQKKLKSGASRRTHTWQVSVSLMFLGLIKKECRLLWGDGEEEEEEGELWGRDAEEEQANDEEDNKKTKQWGWGQK